MKIHVFTRRQFISMCGGAGATALGFSACSRHSGFSTEDAGLEGDAGFDTDDSREQTDRASDDRNGNDSASTDSNFDDNSDATTDTNHMVESDTDDGPLSETDSDDTAKPAVVWLQAQDCAGCTESVLSSTDVDIREFLLNRIALRYHATLIHGTGRVAEEMLSHGIDEGGFVLIVEGTFPGADSRFLVSGAMPLEERFVTAARNASVVVALGACAAFGGIPKAGKTNGESVQDVMKRQALTAPLINLPGCPVHPRWFFDTIEQLLGGSLPELDQYLRPLAHFSTLVHDQCPRRDMADSALCVTDWNSTIQRGHCLRAKGCRGKVTYADCPTLMWNGVNNWCIGSDAPCSGCTEPHFYDGANPLYVEQTKK
jgi:hydrogenase small subunit